jgi:hypothetical protein
VGATAGFLRYDPVDDPGSWDLRLHPVGACTDADTTSTTGGPVGALLVAPTGDQDTDLMADAWERAWFGDLVTADGATDTNGDAEPDATEYATCQNPVP